MTIKHDTAGFVMNQTMLRIKDPKITLPFYEEVLGMTTMAEFHFESMNFSLYFMGYLAEGQSIPDDPSERAKWVFGLPAPVTSFRAALPSNMCNLPGNTLKQPFRMSAHPCSTPIVSSVLERQKQLSERAKAAETLLPTP